MNNYQKNIQKFGGLLISTTLVLQPTLAQAQIQRSFLNPSFEQPVFSNSCYIQVDESQIPGWTTTHNTKQGTATCATTGFTTLGKIIEIWTKGFSSVNTATGAGNQFAELNAEEEASLFQKMCLIQGETVNFSLLHRGRGNANVPDVATFSIGATTFGTFSTTNNGTVPNATPIAGTNTTLTSPVSAGNGWVRYSGTVIYNGTNGIQDVGFKAVSTGSGSKTVGNFLDQVDFYGLPFIEFTTGSGGSPESETTPTTNPARIRVVGLVTSNINVPIKVTGGTAILGTDYTTPTGTTDFTVSIPAGNYDGGSGSIFTIPVTITNDDISEGDETIEFTILSSSQYIQSSTTTCGGAPILTSTYTMFDDDFITGKVWDDADGSANNTFNNINTGTEAGTNAGGLNAILINASGNVIASTPINADGTYLFNNLSGNQNNVKIILSTTTGIVGAAAPAPSLPANWTNTSPVTTAPFNTLNTSITGKDFGIEQLPNTNSISASPQNNPGGTNKVQVPTLSGTDPEDGNLGSGKSFKIVTLPTNGTLYYNNIAVVANQVINSYDPTKLTLDPNDGAITVNFTVAAVDAAGKEDPTPATVTMQFTSATVGNSKLLLVKRITRINNQDFTNIVDGSSNVNNTDTNYVAAPRDTDDNDSKWPANYLRGLINAGTVKPADILEYTIYFLSSGLSNAVKVKLCDLVPNNTTFLPTAFNGLTPNDGGLADADQGMAMAVDSTTPTVYFSNVADSDRGTFYPANDPNTPSFCNNIGNNTNGAVVVEITRNSILPTLSPDSYGFVRFRAKVK
ncbi:hypothetical protein [Anabaena sp. UHCC 0399]|uniref:hypothetical protein n=1 Tax=Anabaena sp. UHCC 0399 TaxID=3110238 RepID=UPI002B1F0118|nr:hypothetical protein [Anabaena sp. UHCC 0399]MEA5567035.1 hypothetical protein [Anabaena sp. UHCC 0399]